jgi:hypothetical protein
MLVLSRHAVRTGQHKTKRGVRQVGQKRPTSCSLQGLNHSVGSNNSSRFDRNITSPSGARPCAWFLLSPLVREESSRRPPCRYSHLSTCARRQRAMTRPHVSSFLTHTCSKIWQPNPPPEFVFRHPQSDQSLARLRKDSRSSRELCTCEGPAHDDRFGLKFGPFMVPSCRRNVTEEGHSSKVSPGGGEERESER